MKKRRLKNKQIKLQKEKTTQSSTDLTEEIMKEAMKNDEKEETAQSNTEIK